MLGGALLACLGMVEEGQKLIVLIAGLWGVLIYVGVDMVSSLLEKEEEGGSNVGEMVKRGGIGGFLYLEVLDASFSFDGVIGAFAITTDVVIIMLGLARIQGLRITADFLGGFVLIDRDKDVRRARILDCRSHALSRRHQAPHAHAGGEHGAAVLGHDHVVLDAHADAAHLRRHRQVVGLEVQAGLDGEDHSGLEHTVEVEVAARLRARVAELESLLNTPETIDFIKAVQLEAAHQRQRHGLARARGVAEHDGRRAARVAGHDARHVRPVPMIVPRRFYFGIDPIPVIENASNQIRMIGVDARVDDDELDALALRGRPRGGAAGPGSR